MHETNPQYHQHNPTNQPPVADPAQEDDTMLENLSLEPGSAASTQHNNDDQANE